MNASTSRARTLLERVGAVVFERGWLSSNNILFPHGPRGAAIVDTGYVAHAAQTLDLVTSALDGQPLAAVVNTHLHSDHCGGNAALQSRWPCQTWVPEASVEAVTVWDEERLTYRYTGQRCAPFRCDGVLSPGCAVALGDTQWHVLPAPGHDPDAVMLFEPQARVLIAGDALWEARVAIQFPELVGAPGFGPSLETLDEIERLDPRVVIPGHGAPFEDVGAALSQSRERLRRYIERPASHHQQAARALVMFHMLEARERSVDDLLAWLLQTPVFQHIGLRCAADGSALREFGREVLARLATSGALKQHGHLLRVA